MGVRAGLISVAGVLVQLALAVAGWGGPRAFFAHRALLALTAATLAFTGVSLFSRGWLSTGVEEDRGNRWVLGAFSVVALLSAYVPALTDRLGVWTLDGDAIRWVGVAIFCLGVTLRLWPVFVLGRRFSGLVAIQRDHRLETGGVYRVIRNPSYLGLLISMLGWALAFRAGVGLVLVGLILPPLVVRIGAEERLLRSHFGGEYEAYYRHTWRLLPGIY